MNIRNFSTTTDVCVNFFGTGEAYEQMVPFVEESFRGPAFDDFRYPISEDAKKHPFLFCVGYKTLDLRWKRFLELRKAGIRWVSLIAPNAVFSQNSTIGEGCFVNQGALIDNYVKIGDAVFINLGSMISHHSKISDNVFIAPGVSIAGYVEVGNNCFIGTNSTIIDHIRIGEGSVVAAGAVVIRDVPPNVMVAGNPAQIKKQLK